MMDWADEKARSIMASPRGIGEGSGIAAALRAERAETIERCAAVASRYDDEFNVNDRVVADVVATIRALGGK